MAQAKQFKEATDISGIILTKLDGTAKGGIAIAIQSELGIPVKYIGIGEQVDDLQRFDPDMFVNALFEKGEEIEIRSKNKKNPYVSQHNSKGIGTQIRIWGK